MGWTKEKPREDGFYWFKGKIVYCHGETINVEPIIVRVFRETIDISNKKIFSISLHGSEDAICSTDGEWVGPLKIPEKHPGKIKLSPGSKVLVFKDGLGEMPFIGCFVKFHDRPFGKSEKGQIWHKLEIKDSTGNIHDVPPGFCYEADLEILKMLSGLNRKFILNFAMRLKGRIKEPLHEPNTDGKYFWEIEKEAHTEITTLKR